MKVGWSTDSSEACGAAGLSEGLKVCEASALVDDSFVATVDSCGADGLG